MPLRRKCGDCNACCIAPKINCAELQKAENVACPHLNSDKAGCGIYHTRPQLCRDFECLWLEERLHVQARPDKIGFLMFLGETQNFGTVLHAMEIWEGAIDEAQKNNFFLQFGKQPILCFFMDGKRTMMNATLQMRMAVAKFAKEQERKNK